MHFLIYAIFPFLSLHLLLRLFFVLPDHHLAHVLQPVIHFVHFSKFIETLRDNLCVVLALLSLELNLQFILQLEALLADLVIANLSSEHVFDIYASGQGPKVAHSLGRYNLQFVKILELGQVEDERLAVGGESTRLGRLLLNWVAFQLETEQVLG